MERLRKIALIGNISKSDVNIEVDGNEIQIFLTNPEKVDSKFNFGAPIASMNWEMNEYQVYINYVVVEPDFRESMLAMYMLKKFEEVILQPMAEQYGKETVIIAAEFQNYALAEVVKNYCKKKGYTFEDTAVMGEDLFVSQHQREGLDVFIGYNQALTFKNTSYDIILEKISEFDDILNQNDFEYCDGYVDTNGDIFITQYQRGTDPSQKLKFNCSSQSVEFNSNSITDLQSLTNVSNFLNNVNIVFSNQEFDFSDISVSKAELQSELLNDKQTASIKQRLKKLAKNQ